MTARQKSKLKKVPKEPALETNPEAKEQKKMVIRTATAEDYRKRAYETVGTFYRFENGKLKP